MGLETNEAEDVVQECTQSVLRHIERYQHLGSFKAWLKRITTNCILDRRRKRQLEQAQTAALDALCDRGDSPDEAWERQWLSQHLRFCVEKIRHQVADHTYRAFEMVVLQERPATEVAAALGLSTNQVYLAKHRVIERVRGQMLELSGVDLAGAG